MSLSSNSLSRYHQILESKSQDSHFIKISILGGEGVGKTSLIKRFCEDKFSDTHIATVSKDFAIKSLKESEKTFQLQIWDTEYNYKLDNIAASKLCDTHAFVVVYDVTQESTYDYALKLIDNLIKNENQCKNSLILLVGNKCDMVSETEVLYETAFKAANKLGVIFLECSAKKGENVFSIFDSIVKITAKEIEEKNNKKTNQLIDDKKDLKNIKSINSCVIL